MPTFPSENDQSKKITKFISVSNFYAVKQEKVTNNFNFCFCITNLTIVRNVYFKLVVVLMLAITKWLQLICKTFGYIDIAEYVFSWKTPR
jgi:hypothetical protein